MLIRHIYSVTIRTTIDTTIRLSASSPERALQLAVNIAAGEHVAHETTATVTDTFPLTSSVKWVDR